MKKERIFVRRIHLKNVFVSEIEAEFAFEINGFRFFYHDRQITDALCGMCVFKQDFSQSKEEYIQRAEYRLRRIFDQYPNAAKKRLRIDWGYKR